MTSLSSSPSGGPQWVNYAKEILKKHYARRWVTQKNVEAMSPALASRNLWRKVHFTVKWTPETVHRDCGSIVNPIPLARVLGVARPQINLES